MRKVFAIVLQDIRVFLADRSNLPGLLLTPVAMTIIIGLVSGGAFGGSSTTLRLDVIDNDSSPASDQFLESMTAANPNFVLCSRDTSAEPEVCRLDGKELDLALGQERVAEGISSGLLVVPAGFGEAVSNRQSIDVELHIVSDFGEGQSAQQVVEAALEQINGAAAAAEVGDQAIAALSASGQGEAPTMSEDAIYQRALAMWRNEPVQVRMEFSGAEGNQSLFGSLQQGLGQSVPGMGTMFVMMTVFGGMAALIEERRQWTLQRLAAMPLSRAQLLFGKILARFSLGVIQFLVIFAVGAALGMNFGQDPIALVLVAISYTLAVTALSFAIGSQLHNPNQAAGLTLLLTLVLAPLGGAWWPLSISPEFMQIAGRISPVSWAMTAFTELTYEGARLAQVYPSILVLLAIALVAFLIGVPRLQYEVSKE